MRPIKNISQSVFGIGKTYQIVDSDDYEGQQTMTIVSIVPCPLSSCHLYGTGNDLNKCESIQLQDENGALWCGIPNDFKEIEK